MIQVDNLTKYYGPIVAVDQVSFRVDRGEIVGFLGPNGAGKTTILRILTSYLPATSGIARVAGFDVMTQSMDVRRKIGYLPQSVPLYPEMRVEEYLLFQAQLKGVDRRQRRARLEEALDRGRIREVRRRLIGSLSGGYRQRVGLANTLLHKPDILILDEPTAGLDPIQIRETLNTIQELGQQQTILLSTHILSEVEAICDRVIIINRGRIGLDRRMDELSVDTHVILLEVRGPASDVASALRGFPEVTSVESRSLADNLALYEVRTRKDKDLREDFARKIAEAGWSLRRLDLRQRKLEDHFVDVVVRAGSPASPAAVA